MLYKCDKLMWPGVTKSKRYRVYPKNPLAMLEVLGLSQAVNTKPLKLEEMVPDFL